MATVESAWRKLVGDLEPIYGLGEAESIARILFEDAFGERNKLSQEVLSDANETRLLSYTDRLLKKEPIQYILGEADFYGLKFLVSPAVLIPRFETEELVYTILNHLNTRSSLNRVLDIGTGSGCIPITLKHQRTDLDVSAIDISDSALAIAQQNAVRHGVDVSFSIRDILSRAEWSNEKFDLIVSNPPYIGKAERDLVPDYVHLYEPHLALYTEDPDRLIFYKEICAFAIKSLNPSGWLFFECNEFTASEVKALMLSSGFKSVELLKDMQGKERVVFGEWGG